MEWKKNDLVQVKITDMGIDGEGIGKIDGYTLFIKDAIVGDEVEASIMKMKKNYGYARLVRILEPSTARVEPKCAYHKQCGGCSLQAMSYDRQLEYKQNKIRSNLIRIGGFDEKYIDQIMEPIVGMLDENHPEPYYYRNKAQYPIGTDKEGRPIAGFYAGRTHSIIANTNCYLGVKQNQEILEIILKHMETYQVRAYDETTGTGLLRHVLIRKGFSSGEIMVCLVVNCSGKRKDHQYIPEQNLLIEKLSKVGKMTSISVSINGENTNVIMGKEIDNLWGSERIRDTIHYCELPDFKEKEEGIEFEISPLSFYQVNPVQTQKLYSLALDYANLTGNETVWDLYCGIGTISLFLSRNAKQVYGVEIIPEAIEDARRNAENNQIKNAQFYVGKAEEVLPREYEKDGIWADVIVVDPPRKGCDEKCLSTMLKMQPDRIVYVSCDSATLARDLRILCDGGYELVKVRGVDQFAHTSHVETVVLMSKVNTVKG